MPEGGAAAVLKEFARADRYVLPAAIRAVGSLGAAGAPAVPALIKLLEGEPLYVPFFHDAFPSVEAIRALGQIGPAAKAGIKVLETLANQKQTETSEIGALEARAARMALSQIQG